MRVWWKTPWRTLGSDDFEYEGTVAHKMEEEVDTQEPKLLRRSRRVRRKNTMYDEGMWCMDQE